jgi:hypothetical protein
MEANWLNATEAVRWAFKYRDRAGRYGLDDYRKTLIVLITDFDRSNLRVFEVAPGDWDNWQTWKASERPMTDNEARYLDWWACCPAEPERRIGSPIGDSPYRTLGYIKRPQYEDWTIMLDVDYVDGKIGYDFD